MASSSPIPKTSCKFTLIIWNLLIHRQIFVFIDQNQGYDQHLVVVNTAYNAANDAESNAKRIRVGDSSETSRAR